MPAEDSPPAPVLQSLRKAADICHELRTSYEDELEYRDRIIMEALDAGWPRYEVARWARVSPARITQVIVRRAGGWS
jgi:hypothetical protein